MILPLDCVGEIFSFFLEKGEDVNTILILSKTIFRYIHFENSMCARKTKFEIQKTPNRVIPYCFRLSIRSCGSLFVNPLPKEILQYFPNLEKLSITGKVVNMKIFKYGISKIQKLDLFMTSVMDFSSFHCLSELKSLKCNTIEDFDQFFLDYFPHLEELRFRTLCGTRKLSFPVLKKLKVLEIARYTMFNGEEYEFCKNIEKLYINNTKFELRHLKHLKNLKFIEIVGSRLDDNLEGKIRKNLDLEVRDTCVIKIPRLFSYGYW